MTFEAGKEYRTRDGRRARVYAVDGAKLYQVHGAILLDAGWHPITWRKDGAISSFIGPMDDGHDLMPPRKQIVRWVNIPLIPRTMELWTSRREADAWAKKDRIACKRIVIKYAEGEFDQEDSDG